jgi:prolyl oligopeptidase PreP (S9A serine peptidase family)
MRHLALLAFCLPLATGGAAAEPPPVWAYFKNPMLSHARISPSGNHISAILSKQGMQMILVWDVRTNEKTPIIKFPGANYPIQWLDWANNKRIVFGMQFRESIGGAGFIATHLYGIDRNGENLRQLSKNWEHAKRTATHDWIASLYDQDPQRILVHWLGRVSSVDVDSGRMSTYHARMGDLVWWMLDPQDRVRGAWKTRRGSLNRSFHARLSDKGPLEKIRMDAWLDGPDFKPLAFHHEHANRMYVLSNHESDRMALYEYDLEEKAFLEKLFEHPRYDLGGGIENREKRLVGVWYYADSRRHHFIDDRARAFQRAIDKALPGAVNRIVDWSRDDERLIIESSSESRVPTTYLFVQSERQMIELFREHPDLTDDQLGPVKKITVTARDGLKFRAFVTLPRDSPAKDLPLVVLVHGGPASRDVVGYHSWTQFLASRGYAVLQANYRGATGYGWDFHNKGFKQWGLAMQDDVTDAANLLIDKGVADPTRVAIFGGSYGGYASYMGLIREPEMFRCGASYGGVSDLHRLLDDDNWWGRSRDALWDASIGKEVADREKLARTSPVNLASRINDPILVAHSRDDQRVPVAHSETMIEALQKAGKPHEMLILDHGMHSLNVERERIKFFETLEDFLARCMAPVAAEAS